MLTYKKSVYGLRTYLVSFTSWDRNLNYHLCACSQLNVRNVYKPFLCLLTANAYLRAPHLFDINYVPGAYFELAFTCW